MQPVPTQRPLLSSGSLGGAVIVGNFRTVRAVYAIRTQWSKISKAGKGPEIKTRGLDVWVRNMVHHKAKLQCSRIDAFDMWALRKILRIPYTPHVTNVEVRATTRCNLLSHLVTDRRLRLFGHIARSSPQEDHHRAVAAVIRGLPPDWKRPLGRHCHTWLT